MLDRADAMLTRLQLTGIRELDSLLDKAPAPTFPSAKRWRCCASASSRVKDHRRINVALKLAHFPATKDL
jgi:hypothetical protein